MNMMLIKMLAVGLTLGQIFTRPAGPQQVQLFFPISTEQEKAESIALATKYLNEGCKFAQKSFDSENIDLESVLMDLANINTKDHPNSPVTGDDPRNAPQDDDAPAAPVADVTIAKPDLDKTKQSIADIPDTDKNVKTDPMIFVKIYKQFCKGETVEDSPIDLVQIIQWYNDTLKDLPDFHVLVGMHLPEATTILDQDGNRFTELFKDNSRRTNIKFDDVPAYVPQAFVSAEDQNFYTHHGLDLRGIIRAFQGGKSDSGHFQGGSTLTQQLIKNRILGDAPNFERKMREMVLASQVETVMSKKEILELYMNGVYMGGQSSGIEMASLNYLGKHARRLTIAEAAWLAGRVQGPNYYDPYLHMDRVMKRRDYVLTRLHDDKAITDAQFAEALKTPAPTLVPYAPPTAKSAYFFLDALERDMLKFSDLKINTIYDKSMTVRSTIIPELQHETEVALQDGLAHYEENASVCHRQDDRGDCDNRPVWEGPLGNLAADVEKRKETWQDLLPHVRTKDFDIHWPVATVLKTGQSVVVKTKNGKVANVPRGYSVGLKDGREMKLVGSANVLATLTTYDLIHVVIDEKTQTATLKIPPHVQGAVVVMEAATGRILSYTGGSTYGESQFDRAGVSGRGRQVGSTIKPFDDMAALEVGVQPNYLVPDVPISVHLPNGHYFTPKNNDGQAQGLVSMRTSIEQSLNIPTVQIACRAFGITYDRSGQITCPDGLAAVNKVTGEFVYPKPDHNYADILGAQESHVITMASAYSVFANIANPSFTRCPTCLKPVPTFFDAVEVNGRLIEHAPVLQPIQTVSRRSIFQMRRILEGSPARGTAGKLKAYKGMLGCKTGTTNGNRDAWLICFTNDIVVATWVGYDRTQTLGPNGTGASVALPIGAKVLEKAFELYQVPLHELNPAPPDIARQIVEMPLPGFGVEAIALDDNNQPKTAVYSLLKGPETALAVASPDDIPDNDVIQSQVPADDQPVARQAPAPDTDDERFFRPGTQDDFQSWNGKSKREVDPDYYNRF